MRVKVSGRMYHLFTSFALVGKEQVSHWFAFVIYHKYIIFAANSSYQVLYLCTEAAFHF